MIQLPTLLNRLQKVLSPLTRSAEEADFWHHQRAAGRIRVAVPTIDSAPYIDLVLAYYRDIGVPVTVFVDGKTTDNTADIARVYADEVIVLDNPASRVGEMLEELSRHCGTQWVLRMDDDELPSRAMMAAVRDAVVAERHDVMGFARYQCMVTPDGDVLYDCTQDFERHRQWRLYRVDRVRFHGRGHTAGFDFNGRRGSKASPRAAMIHLDWVVHPPEQRMRKLQRYEAHTPGDGVNHRDHYLGDQAPDLRSRLRPLPAPEFAWVAAHLAARFPAAAVDSR